MPNWENVAKTIATGMFSDDWNKRKKDESELASEEQRRNLLQSAESRAVELHDRAKSKWGAEDEETSLNLGEKRNKAKVYEDLGGPAGEVKRFLEALKQAEEAEKWKREYEAGNLAARQREGDLSAQRVGLDREQWNAGATQRREADEAAVRGGKIGQAGLPADIEKAMYDAEDRRIAQLDNTLKTLKGQEDSEAYKVAQEQLEKALIAREKKRSQGDTFGGGQPAGQTSTGTWLGEVLRTIFGRR